MAEIPAAEGRKRVLPVAAASLLVAVDGRGVFLHAAATGECRGSWICEPSAVFHSLFAVDEGTWAAIARSHSSKSVQLAVLRSEGGVLAAKHLDLPLAGDRFFGAALDGCIFVCGDGGCVAVRDMQVAAEAQFAAGHQAVHAALEGGELCCYSRRGKTLLRRALRPSDLALASVREDRLGDAAGSSAVAVGDGYALAVRADGVRIVRFGAPASAPPVVAPVRNAAGASALTAAFAAAWTRSGDVVVFDCTYGLVHTTVQTGRPVEGCVASSPSSLVCWNEQSVWSFGCCETGRSTMRSLLGRGKAQVAFQRGTAGDPPVGNPELAAHAMDHSLGEAAGGGDVQARVRRLLEGRTINDWRHPTLAQYVCQAGDPGLFAVYVSCVSCIREESVARLLATRGLPADTRYLPAPVTR